MAHFSTRLGVSDENRGVYKELVAGTGITINEEETTVTLSSSGGNGGSFTSKCSVYLGTNQNIPSTVFTKIDFDTELYDTDNEFNLDTNRFIATEAGYYNVSGAVRCESLTVGKHVLLGLYVNDVLVKMSQNSHASGTTEMTTLSADVYLAANDYLELLVYINEAETILAGREHTYFDIHRFA